LNEAHIEPREDLHPLPLRDEEHATHIGICLKPPNNKLVSQTLIEYAYLFAWITSDMAKVSPDVYTSSLSIQKSKTNRPKEKKMGEEKHNVAPKKADKLDKVGFIQK